MVMGSLQRKNQAANRQQKAEIPPIPEEKRSWLARLGLGIAALVAIGLDFAALGSLGAGFYVAITLAELPHAEALRTVQLQQPMRIYSADGRFMGAFGLERREPVSFEQIPPQLIQAFLATEDSRFFEHEGIDLFGLGRAALSFLRTGERRQGGSTITMQVARNFFLSREKTFHRKFSEILLSLHIERTLTKQEILELYLNKIFFGHRAYGISAAAALYYDKPLRELSLAQMAMLAGIPKAPSANNPVSNPKRALARRNYILGRMWALGYIDEQAYQMAKATPDDAALHRPPVELQADYVAELVRRELVKRLGESAYREGLRVITTLDSRLQPLAEQAVRTALLDYDRRHGYRGPEAHYAVANRSDQALDALLAQAKPVPLLQAALVVRADAESAQLYLGDGQRETLELAQVRWARPYKNENAQGRAPQRVDQVLHPGDLVRLRKDAEGRWELAQRPAVSGALVVLDPSNGAVLALMGGYDYGESKFNRAVDARRQPGSSFKPFIYAAALEQGWTPASLIRDEPLRIRLGPREVWTPKNFDHKNLGPIRLRLALTQSRNLASVFLLKQIGLEKGRAFAARFGFSPKAMQPVGLSLVLGTLGASPLQMAGAYAVFANGGFRVLPHFIQRIENSAGEVLFESQVPKACAHCWFYYEEERESGVETQGLADSAIGAPEAERVLEPRIAYQMHSMMGDVIRYGTARRALKLKRDDLAGKTGTTNEVRDSWFCGYQKDLVAVAWMGFDRFQPLGRKETGGRAGLGLWMNFMGPALANTPEAKLAVPEGLVAVRIDKRTGLPTRSQGKHTQMEWIREEYLARIQGPAPVQAPQNPRQFSQSPHRPAPRAIDELF